MTIEVKFNLNALISAVLAVGLSVTAYRVADAGHSIAALVFGACSGAYAIAALYLQKRGGDSEKQDC